MHVRVCPDCGEEFRPGIVTCSDCGALLQDRHLTEGADGSDRGKTSLVPPPDAETESAEDYVIVFSSIEADGMREAAAALVAAGIAFRANGNAAGFQLLVHPEDQVPAVQALAGRDGAVTQTSTPGPDDGHFCPACGTEVAVDAVECPACELVIGGGAADAKAVPEDE
jgi:hypothetical protein